MKKTFFVFIAFLLLAASCKREQAGVVLANVAQFEEANSKDGVQLIDVRTPEEFAEGHIKNAVNININDAEFRSKIQALDKAKPVLVYCKAGGRSATASAILNEEGFVNIVDLDGGITAWKKNMKDVVE